MRHGITSALAQRPADLFLSYSHADRLQVQPYLMEHPDASDVAQRIAAAGQWLAREDDEFARVASRGFAWLTLEQLRPIHDLCRTAIQVAPQCGLPYLLEATLASEYYEPQRLQSPVGRSVLLFEQAFARKVRSSDHWQLRDLLWT